MIDFANEELLTLTAAAKMLPGKRAGKRMNVSTVWRWTKRGIGGIRLETLLVGGTRYTSMQAIQRFFERTTAASDGANDSLPVKTLAQRRRVIEAAERELMEGL